MRESKTGVPPQRQATSANRRRFSEEFKRDAVRLIVDEQYTFKAAAKAVGISEKSLRDWHRRLAPGVPACGQDASGAGLGVATAGYYDSGDRPPSPRAERHERIKEAVAQAHAESHGIYGSHKIAAELNQREDLETACRNTVGAAMQEMGLKSRVSKAFTPAP